MGDEREGSPFERLRARKGEPDRYGLLLVMIVASTLLIAGSQPWAKVATAVLQGAIVLFALYTARAQPRTLRVALLLVPLALVLAVVGHVNDSEAAEVVAASTLTLLPAAAIVALGRRLITHPYVSLQTVLGILSIYLLLGITFAALYQTLDVASSGPFFAQTQTAARVDFLYFSFITMTTVGYGDLTAVASLPRMLAATQALMGQLYLVTVVAVAVSRVSRRQGREG